MEKAYDVKDLALKLKDAGVPIAEDALEAMGVKFYLVFKKWAQESAVLSENKVDDLLAPFYDQVDPIVLPLIDKIDGQQG